MPKAAFAIWWDDRLGPSLGRSYPHIELSEEDILNIFMGHGLNSEAKIGYTKIRAGLVISYMQAPTCIGILLDENDDPDVIERNLLRLVPYIDITSDSWDDEIKKAYETLVELIHETSGEEFLSKPEVKSFIQEIKNGHIKVIAPKYTLQSIQRYKIAEEFFGNDPDEVVRILQDLERENVVIPKSFGRRLECRQCGDTEVAIELHCPRCDSRDLHNVFTVFCPKCSEQFQTVIIDELTEVRCQNCHEAVKVSELSVIDVEPLCNNCGTASDEPKIVLTCATCGKKLKGADLLGGTGLAYYPSKEYFDSPH